MALIDDLFKRVEDRYNSNFYPSGLDAPTRACFKELCGIIEERLAAQEHANTRDSESVAVLEGVDYRIITTPVGVRFTRCA